MSGDVLESERPRHDLGVERLDTLGVGACAEIVEANAPLGSDPSELHRIEIQGLCAGRHVEVLRAGDPMILRVFGARLGIAARFARSIWVRSCDPRRPSKRCPQALPSA